MTMAEQTKLKGATTKSYKTLPVTLRLPEDQDILDIIASLPGPASPWVREAIRDYAQRALWRKES